MQIVKKPCKILTPYQKALKFKNGNSYVLCSCIKNRQAGFTLIEVMVVDCHFGNFGRSCGTQSGGSSDKARVKPPKRLYPPPQMPLICLKWTMVYPTTKKG